MNDAIASGSNSEKHRQVLCCYYLLKALWRLEDKGGLRQNVLEEIGLLADERFADNETKYAVEWCVEKDWVETWTDDFNREHLAITGRGKARLVKMPC